MTEEEMTNSRRLKRTFSHAIKSSSGDCELRETYKSPVLWLQLLPPAQNDLWHRVTGILGKLRHVGKRMSCWATGQTVYCTVVWLHLLGQFRLAKTLKRAFGSLSPCTEVHGLDQGWRSSSHPLGCRASVQEKIPELPPLLQECEQLPAVESWAGHLLAMLLLGMPTCWHKLFLQLRGSMAYGVWSITRTWQGDPGRDMASIATKPQGMSCQQGWIQEGGL